MLYHYSPTKKLFFFSIGPPQAVNIICTSSIIKTLYVKCNWTVPYTIEGVKITHYNVNITKDEQILHNDSVTDTHYSYLSGTYTVSVAAVVGKSLEGEINSWEMNVSKGTSHHKRLV